MNIEEHILTVLAEECAEVTQRCTKALRFGLDDFHPTSKELNKNGLRREIEDLLGVIRMLVEHSIIEEPSDDNINAKVMKVMKYLSYSESVGKLK